MISDNNNLCFVFQAIEEIDINEKAPMASAVSDSMNVSFFDTFVSLKRIYSFLIFTIIMDFVRLLHFFRQSSPMECTWKSKLRRSHFGKKKSFFSLVKTKKVYYIDMYIWTIPNEQNRKWRSFVTSSNKKKYNNFKK